MKVNPDETISLTKEEYMEIVAKAGEVKTAKLCVTEITVDNLTEVLELVRKAVDGSGMGPVYQMRESNNDSAEATKVVSPLGAQVFTATLQVMLAKYDTIRLIKNPDDNFLNNN